MQNQFVDLYRNGIKTATEVTRMSLENAVRLHEKQLGLVRNVLEENRRSADALTEAKSLEDLMAAQSRIAGAQLERAAEFWSSLWHAAADGQKAWIEQVQTQLGRTRENVRETYDLTARTSEELARIAANQVSRATGSIREAASAAQERPRKSA
jgi:Phasin protein